MWGEPLAGCATVPVTVTSRDVVVFASLHKGNMWLASANTGWYRSHFWCSNCVMNSQNQGRQSVYTLLRTPPWINRPRSLTTPYFLQRLVQPQHHAGRHPSGYPHESRWPQAKLIVAAPVSWHISSVIESGSWFTPSGREYVSQFSDQLPVA